MVNEGVSGQIGPVGRSRMPSTSTLSSTRASTDHPAAPEVAAEGFSAPASNAGRWSIPRYALLVAALLAASFSALLLPASASDFFADEDGFFETIGALGFLIASALFALVFRQALARGAGRIYLFVVLALAGAFFIGAGEEISWGQRWLGVHTPAALEAINRQNEINVHNIGLINEALNMAKEALWFGLACLIPVAAAMSSRLRPHLRRLVPVFPLAIGAVFLLNHLFSEAARAWIPAHLYEGTESLAHAAVEIKEGNLGVLFAVAALILLQAGRKRRTNYQAPDPSNG